MNWHLLANSFLVAGATTVAALTAGSLAGLVMVCLSSGWRRGLLGCAVVSLALPPFLVTNCWLDLLGQTGLLHSWVPVNIYSRLGTVWVLSLLFWPISAILVSGSLQSIQSANLEAEPALRGWPLLRYLIIPTVQPALFLSAALTFVLAFSNFAVPAILQTKVFPAEVWVSFNTTFDYWTAVKLGWPLLAAGFVLAVILPQHPIRWPRVSAASPARLIRERLGQGWFLLGSSTVLATVAFSVGVPLGNLVFSRQTWLELPAAFAAGHQAIFSSAWLSGCAAILGVAGGLVLWRWRIGSILWVTLYVPGVFLGILCIYLFNRPGLFWFYQSTGIVLAVLVVRYSGLCWSGVRRARQSVDRLLEDFARLQGATRWQMIRHVHWPQIAPGLGATWFVVYLLCLWDVESMVLLNPPGSETLALRIFNLLHYGHNSQVNALCLILVSLAVMPLGIWCVWEFLRRAMARPGRLAAVLLATLPGLWTGCQPGASRTSPVQSRFFASVQVIGTRGSALGQFNKPRSLTVDGQDNLYVVDMTGRVQKFSSDGVYLLSWQMPQTEKGKPKGMCLDREGNIIVVEPHYGRVNHFSTSGRLIRQWGQPGTNLGQLCLPRAAAIDSHGEIFVCEYTVLDRVQEFASDGHAWKSSFGRTGPGPGEFNRPEGLAVDSKDRIYVADSCNHRIQVFSQSGQLLRSYGHAGSGLGELSYPYDIQVDKAGYQYVCEFGNSRIQIFDDHDQPVEILGGTGAAPGQLNNPWSMALDSAGNLYVADSQNHRVQKFLRKAGPVSFGVSARFGAQASARHLQTKVCVPIARS